MELRHLRYFIAVAEELNFTKAAKKLHTAQPSLSQQIKDLEDYIGSTLLERNKRRVSLTKAGEVFFQQARLILDNAEKAKKNGPQSGTRTNCANYWICAISRS
ncbi:LysR family transcriptional regulator [Photorhabdus hindustanensis]|uniref:LysR family transcriptional regulator n=1 Tax=Photorhabdus hindustanensis TaxID=2918802 RepID=UPI0020015F40|nr:LysR family transcriptional regulator [Photorhabdus hindustanensis]